MPQILLSEGPDQGVRLLTLNRPEAIPKSRLIPNTRAN